MTAQTRLTEIAESLQRGDALSGALLALQGWEARNIGAARMREHLFDALIRLDEVAAELRYAEAELISQHESMAQELERRPVRLSVWARIFGGKSH
jgi:hypothetical protein